MGCQCCGWGVRYRVAVLCCYMWGLCVGFNIDVSHPRLFYGPAQAQFGYKVLQWGGTPMGAIGRDEGSPMGAIGRGGTHPWVLWGGGWAPVGSAAPWLFPPERNAHFGMTLLDSKDGGFMACAPLWSQPCGTSLYSTGICAPLSPPSHPAGCSTYMDIVIVLDGSNSIYPWYEVQNFLSNILSKFFIGPGQIQVGVLQYGELAVHEWDLDQFHTVEDVVAAAKNISRQEGRETRTALAIREAWSRPHSAQHGGAVRMPRACSSW
uniref:Uncharacterized protein n=1 Tax=Melopsittacus undulatus TaxID=13146 RepID=A0A8V5GR51_MELUD